MNSNSKKSNHILESSFYHLDYDNSRKFWRSEGDWKNSCQRLTLAGLYGGAVKFRRQKKAAKTLGIVVGCFLLCWFPFFIILPLDAACSSCHLSGTIFNLTFWLGYFNSCLNPFIYVCSSRELRRAFRHILCRRRKSSIHKRRALNCR